MSLVLLVQTVFAQTCLQTTSFFIFSKTRCLSLGECCQNNLECQFACCDPYLFKCNPITKTQHFLDNLPKSTACMPLLTPSYKELEQMKTEIKYCDDVFEKRKSAALLLLIIIIVAGVSYLAIGILIGVIKMCLIRKRNRLLSEAIAKNEQLMLQLIDRLKCKDVV